MKLSRFWKIYLISFISAICVVAIGLGVFYGLIDSYEKSQPEYAAQAYADALTDKMLSRLVMDALPETISIYETREELRAFCMLELDALDGSFTVRKDYKNYSSAKPSFNIIKDSVVVACISLARDEDGSFGMKRWRIEKVSALPENWTSPPMEYMFYVPAGASLTINNVDVSDEDLTDTDIPYTYTSVYEPNSSSRWNIYTARDLHMTPNVSCSWGDDVCPSEIHGNTYLFKYPASAENTYTITVPQEAVVSVNKIPLTEKDITARNIPYEYHKAEAALSTLPTAVTYSVSGLFDVPEMKAVLGETELEFSKEGSVYTAVYPADMLYSCTIRVPAGSTVTLHGTDCSAYLTGQETAFTALSAHITSLPVYDVYTVSGLYTSPAEGITVTLNGEALPFTVQTDGYTVGVRAGFAYVENKEIDDRAIAFVRDYITYTAQGYNNLDANLQRVLAYVLPYTEAYSRIANSRIGIYYVTPVTANEYRKLDVSSIIEYSDDLYGCTVDFDVMQKTYYVQNDYAGQIQLLFVKKNGVWKVADMQIDSK